MPTSATTGATPEHSDPALAGPLFDADGPSEAAVAALLAHPRFPAAIRVHARGIIGSHGGNRIINMVITDRARLLISIFAVHLHHVRRPSDQQSGLTASRMRALCLAQGVCSPGRAEAMLVIMRMFGYLAPAPSEEDRRMRRLVPTERLMELHRRRTDFAFEAIAQMYPEGSDARSELRSPEFLERFISHFAEVFLSGFYYVERIPELKLFFDYNGGIWVLYSLMQAGEPDDTAPPAGPVPLSISALARNFGISRGQLRRLLQLAVSEGLLERGTSGETVRVLPRLADAVRRGMAFYMLQHLHCARLALAELGQERAVA